MIGLAFRVLLLLSAIAGCHASPPQIAKDNDAPPNFVLIVAEDLSPRLAAYGDKTVSTPSIDALANSGLVFSHVFTASGVCAPSRAALITGIYPQALGAQHMRARSFGRTRTGPFGTFSTDGQPYEVVPPIEVKAFPELLRQLGYYTWNRTKTDYQIGTPFTIWDKTGSDASLDDLPTDRPFLAMFSQNATHESRLFQQDFAGATDGSLQRAEDTDEALGELDQRTLPSDVTVPDYLPDTEIVRTEIARQYDNISRLDLWTGELMENLEARGLLDNTIVIWTTDHGDGFPRAKRALYDSGLHVPMIVTGPGRFLDVLSERQDELISFVDLAPTIVAIAGGQPSAFHQGNNLSDRTVPARSEIYAARGRLDEHPDRSFALRTQRYKLLVNENLDRPVLAPLAFRENLASMQEIRRLDSQGLLSESQSAMLNGPRAPIELYDLSVDPWEIDNIAELPEHAERVNQLQDRLVEWLTETGDLGVLDERRMVEEIFWGGVEHPTTSPPEAEIESAGEDHLVSLKSPTEGASIGYQIVGVEQDWQLYRGPVLLQNGMMLRAKAQRYGFHESAEVEVCIQSCGVD